MAWIEWNPMHWCPTRLSHLLSTIDDENRLVPDQWIALRYMIAGCVQPDSDLVPYYASSGDIQKECNPMCGCLSRLFKSYMWSHGKNVLVANQWVRFLFRMILLFCLFANGHFRFPFSRTIRGSSWPCYYTINWRGGLAFDCSIVTKVDQIMDQIRFMIIIIMTMIVIMIVTHNNPQDIRRTTGREWGQKRSWGGRGYSE